jgi:hypothetical protein
VVRLSDADVASATAQATTASPITTRRILIDQFAAPEPRWSLHAVNTDGKVCRVAA